MRSITATVFAVLLLFSTCTKDEGSSNTIKLLSRSWKMTAQRLVSPIPGYPENWFSPGCYTDMIWTYQSTGIFLHQASGSCAAAGYPDSYRGKWQLLDNRDIQVQYTGSGFADFTFTIIELNKGFMRVQRTEKVGVGGSTVLDMRFQYDFIPAD
jgi:hypothetical protein